ncbi:MAG: hypothetical protein E7Z89_07595 [Cyanobacteria bacterium SIG28]|nr:hypothetical protein [Cyanobacteria bacterium SIG28]
MRNYLKNRDEKEKISICLEDIELKFSNAKESQKKFILISSVAVFCIFSLLTLPKLLKFDSIAVNVAEAPQVSITTIETAAAKRGTIAIPTGMVKANPFVPYRNLEVAKESLPDYAIIEPPEISDKESDAIRVMNTVVSGILYDKYSPSAILNIEGNDYLVKKDDVINNYKVLDIQQNSVTVQLGANVYKAGIGELLTEGELKHNNVSNLSNKFGGVNNES